MRTFAPAPLKPASTFLPVLSRSFPALDAARSMRAVTPQPELSGIAAHPVTDVLQRSGKGPGKNNKKQQKQKAAAKAAASSRQSKADRNANVAARYGDHGRTAAAQEAVKDLGRKGKIVAHGKGGGGSHTSSKFKSIMKEVPSKPEETKEDEEDYPEDYSEHPTKSFHKDYKKDDDEPGPSGGAGLPAGELGLAF